MWEGGKKWECHQLQERVCVCTSERGKSVCMCVGSGKESVCNQKVMRAQNIGGALAATSSGQH